MGETGRSRLLKGWPGTHSRMQKLEGLLDTQQRCWGGEALGSQSKFRGEVEARDGQPGGHQHVACPAGRLDKEVVGKKG